MLKPPDQDNPPASADDLALPFFDPGPAGRPRVAVLLDRLQAALLPTRATDEDDADSNCACE